MDPADAITEYLRDQANASDDPQVLEALRTVLTNRFKSAGDTADVQLLDETIHLDQRLLRLYNPLNEDYISKCSDLSDDFYMRFFRTRSLVSLKRAVYFSRLIAALRLPSPGAQISREDAIQLATSSIVIAEAAQEQRSETCFEEALSLARTAAAVPDSGNLGDTFFARNIGHILEKRFNSFGREEDLAEVVDIFKVVAAAAEDDVEQDPVEKHFELGRVLFQYWEIHRDPEDLSKAIRAMERMLTVPVNPNSKLQNMLLHYTNRLFSVYTYYPEVIYLDKIDRLLEKVSELPTTDMLEIQLSFKVARGASYDIRAERSNDADLAQAAIKVYEESLLLAPKKSEVQRILLNNLINSSIRYCIYTHAAKDLIKDHLNRVEARLSEDGIPNDSGILLNSARLQYLWYQQDASGDSALIEAKKRVDRALEISDNVISSMAVLAVPILNEYYGLTKKPVDFDAAYSLLMKLWNSSYEGPHVKIRAARDLASLLYEVGRFREAWEYLKEAVEIISLACPRRLPKDDQKFIISTLSGLSNDACALGIAAGVDMNEILQTLERGRGLAVALSHRASQDLQHLTPESRQLLAQVEDSKSRVYFSNLDASLRSPEIVEGRPGSHKAEVIRKNYHIEFEELSAEAKKHAELQNILDPPVPASFHDVAVDGPVIVVNSSGFRNDVILITESKISSFQLDDKSPLLLDRYGHHVTVEKVARNIIELITRVGKGQWHDVWSRNKVLQGMLMWLWDYVVERVCQALELPLMSDSPLDIKRIWWLPTGFFTQMPFHAAGNFLDGSPDEVMVNRAISSYVSTFRMLKWARSRSKNLSNVSLDGMLVTMTAPKSKRPPSETIFVRTAQREADCVEKEAKRITWFRKEKPSVADVMAQLPKRSFMHFCCHGESDPDEPSLSHLKLFKKVVDADDDPRNVDRLTAGDVSTAASDCSVLAVLSACYTAEIRHLSHLDEGLQLGNAFQIAGFPHVIGSLWAASDVACPKWSRKFYSSLNDLIGAMPLGNAHIALAYHQAMIEILNEDPEFAILWAPFVHIGP